MFGAYYPGQQYPGEIVPLSRRGIISAALLESLRPARGTVIDARARVWLRPPAIAAVAQVVIPLRPAEPQTVFDAVSELQIQNHFVLVAAGEVDDSLIQDEDEELMLALHLHLNG